MTARLVKALPLPAVMLALLLLPAAASATFGFKSDGIQALNSNGTPDVQAGSHPFEMTTGFAFDTRKNIFGEIVPDKDVKDIAVELPPGLVGDPSATPKCTVKQFHTPASETAPNPLSGSTCPGDTQVGVAKFAVVLGVPVNLEFGVYNLVPPAGVPAEFGFNPLGLAVTLLPRVRTGGDNGITVHVDNVSQVQPFLSSSVTLWGIPSEVVHNKYRGNCLGPFGESLCEEPSDLGAKPFLRMPTSCPGTPLTIPIRADSWQEPGASPIEATPFNELPGGAPALLGGCESLDFSPSLSLAPQSHAANTPTAVGVDLHMPQSENPAGLGEADLRNATVALPSGLTVNPAAADGLVACSRAQIAIDSAAEPSCPEDSKIGTVEVVSPLLEQPLQGAVYQAEQGNNPFGSLLAFYIVAQGEGVTVKLPGEAVANPLTGQLTTRVTNAPQLPFSDFRLHFFGGPHAPLATPACGTYAASTSLASWAGGAPVSPAITPFSITESCGGGFAPSFLGGTVSNRAGAFSPLAVEVTRSDSDQSLEYVSVKTPPGLLAMLSNVTPCNEQQVAQNACPASSRIGHVTVRAGVGSNPVLLPQPGRQEDPVFLTGPYKGAPFGLLIVGHAEAGPFNLGQLLVRAAIHIDPHTAQVTVVSDPLPRMLQGIPLDIRTVTVTVDREDFIFNPTDCEPLAVTGTVGSALGAAANVSSRFQAADCASLPFKPRFTVSTWGQSTKKLGASLNVKVTSGTGQANIGRVVVSLPRQLPARLTTLQKACTEAVFAQNPAGCPAASDVGWAKAVTPVLNQPLIGPAYLVSHGGAAFPDLVVILEGQGIRLDLVGGTSIKKSITTSTFATVPDAPISSFELRLPQGPNSALAGNLPAPAHGVLCGVKLLMPTAITGQNGAQVKQSTRIAVSGCPKAVKASAAGRAAKRARGRA